MKIIIKSLKKVPYEVKIDSEEISVKELKQEIEKKHGFDAECIKILFKGSMLDDKKLIKDYKITEDDFLTMMNSKVKPQNLNMIKENKIPEESKVNNCSKDNKNSNNIEKNNQIKDNNSKQKNSQSLVSGIIETIKSNDQSLKKEPEKDYSSEIKQLTEMGFEEGEAKRAIKSAKGNIERAVDYLYNGIPENVNNNGQNNSNITNQLNELQNLGIPLYEDFLDPEDEEDEDYEGEIPLTFEINPQMLDSLNLKDPNSLKIIASFVKVLISEDASSLQNLLEDIEETNPEIIELIKKNEDEFKQLISAPLNDKDLEQFLPMANNQNLNLFDHPIEDINNNHDFNNFNEIENNKEKNINEEKNNNFTSQNENTNKNIENLNIDCLKDEEDSNMIANKNELEIKDLKNAFNEEDKESIERLKSLGFNHEEVCQAFLACEKNEMVTANFLLENKFKDPDSMDVDGKII